MSHAWTSTWLWYMALAIGMSAAAPSITPSYALQAQTTAPASNSSVTAQSAACPMSVPALSSTQRGANDIPGPAWDLRCIQLHATPRGGDAKGVVDIRRPPSPFGVTVNADGYHVYDLSARVEGLPDPSTLGPYTTYVAWVTPLALDPVVNLGEVRDGKNELGQVAFAKYLVLISAEASADVSQRDGPLVLRGRSPSSRMEAHDLLATSPAAEGVSSGGADADSHEAMHGDRGMGGDWDMPPAYPDVPMLPGIMALRPDVAPLKLNAPSIDDLPEARPSEVVALPNGGTLDLFAGFVRRTIQGREMVMLAFNEQQPGPMIRVAQDATIFVNFTNNTPFPTAVHWHGLRLDNANDGVPGVTQDPVAPGESFQYRIHFPDAGIYWYHPHHREDVQQELGLAGNMLVDPIAADTYGPSNQEQVLMLDDLLLASNGVVPFGDEAANYALMGRFGNTLLINGEPAWTMDAARGEVVRFFFTNASNTRTFNLSFRNLGDSSETTAVPLRMKIVASDVGRFEREEWTDNVTIAPAERYVVDVLFPKAGEYVLGNHVMGINHRQGLFRSEVTEMGRVLVSTQRVAEDYADKFAILRVNQDVVADIDRYRPHFDQPVDHELVLALEADSLPELITQSMGLDWVFFNPVEWTGTMPVMNWAVSANQVRWNLREPSTGRKNMDIVWRFRVGDVVKIRVHNDRRSFHAMQHPLHIHGQRFLVLEQDGVSTENLVWKDTVLLPAGSTTDILLELSNPGRWMVHCHIAEHLEAGMKFVFEVEGLGL